MTYDFSNTEEKQMFLNFKGLMKNNNGFFKSSKQANFLFKMHCKSTQATYTSENHTQFFGISFDADQAVAHATLYMRWADYGSRSVIPVLYVFVLDRFGVVVQYKVNGRGNLRDGWAPDPKKCVKQWERPAGVEFPVFEESQKTAENLSSWVGVIGEKLNITAKIVAVRDCGFSRFGEMILTVLKDEAGNVMNVWKNLGEVGETLKLRGTVKALDEYRGAKQTTLTRVKVIA
jgi:hypothetical protein